MKKITDFIVDKRYIILITFIILSGICLFLSKSVTINYDIAEYLPNTSETRIGMDIMESDFKELKSSDLNIMFTDLVVDEKQKVKEVLESIENVESVDYEEGEVYNKDNHTLYVVHVNDTEDSNAAANVYEQVVAKFEDKKMVMSGGIAERNQPVLHTWIIALAIGFAMVILIIMCESYVEPFLFLFSIGLAVFMNMGTNLIFSSVSNITNAIAAILQLALSMDYSIMLMNRYSEEREKKDKIEAMKEALGHAFSSISSSSVTTIVGLLALVFMSFTIGRDLGFVLAKGVLFSLLSIFLTLPAMILLCDNIILKTKKKSITIKLDSLGKTVFHLRYPALLLFLVLLVVSFLMKDGLRILYTGSENDEVGQVFTSNNQMAIIYKNEYEDMVSDYCKSLENNENVDEILCYGNTIHEDLPYDAINEKLSELGVDTSIDEYLLKIIYYYYNHPETKNKMSLNAFLYFIDKEVLTNPDLKDQIDADAKKNIKKLDYFATKKEINKKRTSSEIADILGIKKSDVADLFVLYHANDVKIKIKLSDFISFINEDVLTNKTYSSAFTKEEKNSIQAISQFANKKAINKKMNAKEIAQILSMDEESITGLMVLYYSNEDSGTALTIAEFIQYLEYFSKNTDYLKGVDVSALLSLKSIAKNENNLNFTKFNKSGLHAIFDSIHPSLVDMVYGAGMQYGLLNENSTMSPSEFVTFTLDHLGSSMDEKSRNNLELVAFLMKESKEKNKYTATELSKILGIEKSKMYRLYTLINVSNGYNYQLSPMQLIELLLQNRENPLVSSKLDDTTFDLLKLAHTIMKGINNDTKYSASGISKMLGIDVQSCRLLYSLYDIENNSKKVQVSLYDFTDFLVKDVITDKDYASKFDKKSIDKLKTIQKLMKSSLKGETYTASEMYKELSKLSDDLNKNLVRIVYIYEGSIHDYDQSWVMTIETIINYLHDDLLKQNTFKDFLDDDMIQKVEDAKTSITDAKDLLVSDVYSRAILNTTYRLEENDTYTFINDMKKQFDKDGIYVIGDSPMALEMNNTFNDELNFITVLTMIAIFVVVAVTFKSLITPLILVLIIQCAVYITMSILSMTGSSVYFISLLIVQSILMGATIDYAIVYTSYYKEFREKKKSIKDSLIGAYNHSIHTILTSASILIIVTLVVGQFASAIAAKICITLSEGTLCSTLLILLLLPPILATFDKFVVKIKK